VGQLYIAMSVWCIDLLESMLALDSLSLKPEAVLQRQVLLPYQEGVQGETCMSGNVFSVSMLHSVRPDEEAGLSWQMQ
jgi:hypothetical protein